MTRTLTTTVAALAALAWLPPSTGAAAAQETTAHEALEKLRREERPTNAPAVRILRQVDGRGDPDPRTSAELDALADELAEIAADATLPEDVRWEATTALLSATVPKAEHGYGGTPYPRARVFDLLVRVYESGYDDMLFTLMRADPVRGMAYMRELFERSERPPICRWGLDMPPSPGPPECEGYSFRLDARPKPFCKAGGYLFGGIVAEAWERTPGGDPYNGGVGPRPFPPGLPEHVEDWHRRCR